MSRFLLSQKLIGAFYPLGLNCNSSFAGENWGSSLKVFWYSAKATSDFYSPVQLARFCAAGSSQILYFKYFYLVLNVEHTV